MYFDYAATTPPSAEVLKTFDAVNRDFWANPHALHRPGVRAEALLEQSRSQVLSLLGAAKGFRCIFTSGATESNNMALKGVARMAVGRGRHIVTGATEHPSVLEVCRFLASEGCSLTVLPVNQAGQVEPESLCAALRPDTVLVSLMHVNNEVGAIQDVFTLGRLVKAHSNALFHVDAAQSVGKFAWALEGEEIDFLTFSAHKFFGLKGSGALILRERVVLPPLFHGGGQEFAMRSGTVDVAQAAALAKALRLAEACRDESYGRVQGFKAQLAAAFGAISGVELNGATEESSPYILNLSVAGVRPETLLQGLAEQGIYISTVSACSSQKTAESHVVRAMTGSVQRAQSSIRVSLSARTTQAEVDQLCSTAGPLIESLRFKRR
jgi:cysteine desulfurase